MANQALAHSIGWLFAWASRHGRAVGGALALVLSWASPAGANTQCVADCGMRCPHITTILAAEACRSNCIRSCPAEVEPQRFGALAYSPREGYSSVVRWAWSQRDANESALGHCRQNSKGPQQCTIAASYVDSCGSVAAGSRGWGATGDTVSTKGLGREKAAAQALSACTSIAGNFACAVVSTSCAKDLTPQEKAESVAQQAAIVRGVFDTLKAVLPDMPGARSPDWVDKAAQDHNRSVGPRPPDLTTTQFVQVCTPKFSVEGSYAVALAQARWAELDSMVRPWKEDTGSQLRKILTDPRQNAQLTATGIAEGKPGLRVDSLPRDASPRCGPGFNEQRYDAEAYFARPGLRPW